MAAKARFLLLPGTNASLIMLTADGNEQEVAIPEKARKTMSWAPVFDSPHAREVTV